MLLDDNTTPTSDLAPLLKLHDYPIDRTYRKLFEEIQAVGFLESIEEGIAKVRNLSAPFALIEQKAALKYLTMEECDLTMTEEEVSKKPYAFAIQHGSPLRNQMNDV